MRGGRARRGRLRSVGLSLLALSCLAALAVVGLRSRRVDPRRLRQQAADAVKAGRYAEAETFLAQLPSRQPLDWILQSKAEQALGRPEAALAALAKVPDSDRLASLARYSEGYIQFHTLHRAVAAEAALLRSVALDPEAIPPRKELLFFYYILSMKRELAEPFCVLEARGQLTFYDVYRACIVVRGEGESRLVIKELEEFVAADPRDRRSRLALAEELRRLGRLTEADRLLEALPESDPSVRALRARLILERGNLTAAEAVLSTGPAGDPNFAPLRGRLALANRDPAAAVREFRIAVAAYPDRRDVLAGLGRALCLVGDRRGAEPYLEAAADLDTLELLLRDLVGPGASSDPDRLSKLGLACEALGRYPEARAWFSLAHTYRPTKATREALSRLAHRDQDPGRGPGAPLTSKHDTHPAGALPEQTVTGADGIKP